MTDLSQRCFSDMSLDKRQAGDPQKAAPGQARLFA